ncbi:CRISPR-associated protein [Lactobacillus pasteurii DSM 23907 = CRBIP 24.76]|uniref:CRISPR system CASCADE complex protein CasE n=1 Tax=Lactobacillus pasteurii DSM 23907 = CRBIP 24.76 TaxID=1423790 RepID=I7LC17_9LACO|nr:type I-E CRISPR-associated protein Cas6/Cse3/CasE [Lactobacillus pasteurii]KRK07371.1 CRISPR-associated protein [Lactobacillus pasteurii DSM 23907 = CRBIP 24.76]TDG77801.1 hypothetical protein C5L33_000025 [Lactobacillus pasteurii]CCI86096.1 CRISPR system CASCADE complex protein CasE [Lactobacillus pasteurii DSM 23907 = CRBIP 24.76]
MYLSRVQIDDHNQFVMRELNHLGAYHNWVEQSFPDEIANSVRLRHLWRIDTLNHKKYLLLLSQNRPDLDKLEQLGVAGTAQTKSYDEFLEKIEQGKKYRFRLTGNPTHKDSKTGRIMPHITVGAQRKWFERKAELSGFKILNFDVVSRNWLRLKKKKSRLELSSVTFEGILEVEDLEQFKQALVKGIGREKAYGMGLLTVIPIEK